MQVITKIVIRGAYIGCKFAIGKTVKGITSPQGYMQIHVSICMYIE